MPNALLAACALACSVLSGRGGEGAADTLQAVLRLLGEGRPRDALERLEREEEALAERLGKARLGRLRARCFFALGEYPAAERALRAALEEASAFAERAELLGLLAEVLSLQGAHEAALEAAERALALEDAAPLREAAVRAALRASRYRDARPHVEAILARKPQHRFARFAYGIVLARSGEYERALDFIRAGLAIRDAEREARVELARAYRALDRPREAIDHLLAVLEEDPWDREAVHLLGRALIESGGPSAARAAAHVIRYFEALAAGEDPSSRAEHFEAAGRPAEAALLRALERERLGDLAAAVRFIRTATGARGPPAVRLEAARFWLRQGLGAEARALAADLGASDAKAAAAFESACAEASRRIRQVEAPPLREALEALFKARWSQARGPLLRVLREARRGGVHETAGRAARLLLALEPADASALEYLIERTRSPDLAVPRLHYAARLRELEDLEGRAEAILRETRAFLRGGIREP